MGASAKLAVATIRVSTEDQHLGPEAQRAAIAQWARREGVEVAAWHEDRLSGATPAEDRPGLLAALADLRSSGAAFLVAAKSDRIARDVVVAATSERLVADAGARVITADGVGAEDTPEGALMRGLLDLFASYERSLIRSRTAAALRAKRQRGERTGSVPLGQRVVDGRLEACPEEAAVIEVARELRSSGMSLRAVGHELERRGLRLRGRKHHAETVRRVTREVAA